MNEPLSDEQCQNGTHTVANHNWFILSLLKLPPRFHPAPQRYPYFILELLNERFRVEITPTTRIHDDAGSCMTM